MITFYIAAGLIALGAAAMIIWPLVSGRTSAADRDTMDAEIFRDQLDEIDRDLARGTIQPNEAEGARVEISRRLLAATQRAKASGALLPAPRGPSGMAAGMLLMGVPALGALLYVAVGAPGAPDQPFAARETAGQTRLASTQRPSQAEAEAQITAEMRQPVEQDPEYVTLVERVKQRLADRPEDAQGQQLLANGLMRLGQWVEARKAFQRLIEISPKPIPAEIYSNMAEALVLAAGGYVSPEAEDAIDKALKADPGSAMAQYYAGLALRQNGRVQEAIQVWEELRRNSAPDAPYMPWLNMMLDETVQMAGGAPGRGPTQEEIDAANEMSEEDRSAMIQGMVDRLAARLAERGGSAQEWAQLIASNATLGDMAGAEKALIDALSAYPEGQQHDALIAHAARFGIGEVETSPTPENFELPNTNAPGPTAEDIAAAQQMSAEDRNSMIEGMVQRLEDRLLSDGGLAEDWLRLINAYVQLDRKEDAARIYELADVALENDPSRGFVREQSLLLGVIR